MPLEALHRAHGADRPRGVAHRPPLRRRGPPLAVALHLCPRPDVDHHLLIPDGLDVGGGVGQPGHSPLHHRTARPLHRHFPPGRHRLRRRSASGSGRHGPVERHRVEHLQHGGEPAPAMACLCRAAGAARPRPRPGAPGHEQPLGEPGHLGSAHPRQPQNHGLIRLDLEAGLGHPHAPLLRLLHGGCHRHALCASHPPCEHDVIYNPTTCIHTSYFLLNSQSSYRLSVYPHSYRILHVTRPYRIQYRLSSLSRIYRGKFKL
mmetsp:Transcript_16337/g.44041  ORF Transcript_16337/g.44041 Transcript_16337/m.44041 type:complete len:261 (+) Transcript_16337:1061-1843(+)